MNRLLMIYMNVSMNVSIIAYYAIYELHLSENIVSLAFLIVLILLIKLVGIKEFISYIEKGLDLISIKLFSMSSNNKELSWLINTFSYNWDMEYNQAAEMVYNAAKKNDKTLRLHHIDFKYTEDSYDKNIIEITKAMSDKFSNLNRSKI